MISSIIDDDNICMCGAKMIDSWRVELHAWVIYITVHESIGHVAVMATTDIAITGHFNRFIGWMSFCFRFNSFIAHLFIYNNPICCVCCPINRIPQFGPNRTTILAESPKLIVSTVQRVRTHTLPAVCDYHRGGLLSGVGAVHRELLDVFCIYHCIVWHTHL